MSKKIFLGLAVVFMTVGALGFAQMQDIADLPAEMRIIDEYTVEPGDTLVTIANERWGNYRLWPALFIVNRDKVENPYLIESGMTLRIPVRVDPGTLSEITRRFLSDTFIEIYNNFQTYGASYRQPARWILLEATYLEPDFFQRYADAITEGDKLWYRQRSGE